MARVGGTRRTGSSEGINSVAYTRAALRGIALGHAYSELGWPT
ncbi:hypothetical protein [Streptomyces lydicus]